MDGSAVDAIAPDSGVSCTPTPADFYVAVDGNDAWSGTLDAPSSDGSDGPFATLARAQAAVKATPHTGRSTPITVAVRGGTYALASTWTLDSSDSGSAEVPIIYTAFGCETPIISGGVAITSWTAGANGALTAQMPTGADFAQLWVNGVRRYRPRALVGAYGTIDAPTASGFHYTDATAFSPSWHNLGDVEVVVFEKWTVSRKKVVSVNAGAQTVTTGAFTDNDGNHGYMQDHRFLVENVLEAIAPGEFYLDSASHVLTYQPAPGESADNVTAIAPTLTQLVSATGLTYTTFRGLTFSHSNYVIPAAGYQAAQALWDVPPAFLLDNAAHVTVDGCTFEHLGNLALDIEGSGGFVSSANDPYAVEVINSTFADLGTSGVRVGYKNAAPYAVTDATATQHVHVANNLITGGGRYLAGGMGIIVGEAHDNLIEHNEIYDFYQTAISVGYTFASQPSSGTVATYPSSLAHDNIIKNNLIHDIGRGVTDDLGGIYLLTGSSTGNLVTGNVIHDVINSPTTGGYGANGLYYDQGTSNVLSHYNLVYRISDALMQQNEGRANTFTNNIFAFGRVGVYHHQFYEPPTILWATFSDNIVLYDRGAFLDASWYCPAGTDCRSSFDLHDENIYDTAAAPTFTTKSPAKDYTLAALQSGESEELGSVIADPMFANPAYGHDDFTLSTSSPALGVGFTPFMISAAGRTSASPLPPAVPDGYPRQEPADPSTFY